MPIQLPPYPHPLLPPIVHPLHHILPSAHIIILFRRLRLQVAHPLHLEIRFLILYSKTRRTSVVVQMIVLLFALSQIRIHLLLNGSEFGKAKAGAQWQLVKKQPTSLPRLTFGWRVQIVH